MTREDIVDAIFDLYCSDDEDMGKRHKEVANKIVDDFESRVCGNCKHGTHVQTLGIGMKMYTCNKKISMYGGRLTPSNNKQDFGCNKFERKVK